MNIEQNALETTYCNLNLMTVFTDYCDCTFLSNLYTCTIRLTQTSILIVYKFRKKVNIIRVIVKQVTWN